MTKDLSVATYILSNNSLLLDATHLGDNILSIQKKIWALVAKCNESKAFVDVVPAMNSLTVYLINSDELTFWQTTLTNWWQEVDEKQHQGSHHKIITRYGGVHGPDLDYVAQVHKLSVSQVIQLHSQVHYQVLFLGFQPGFAYLHGLDKKLTTPRRSEPRTRVPKGSVAIGANQTAIYPADSPGGWHIIGHTNHPLFDTSKETPCTIAPGDTLEFVVED
ncbi:MAG: 5-oxoprolinase subunit PxpB [Pseudoalteromonas sp.]|uniref:5-oxoprolinase subunit PxpB n=1 Tax=unclassified Pseudoalteromonas TaxID=194690 RepID=UPI003F977A3B